MATSRFVRRFEQVLGLIGVLALVITYSLITGWNPFPDLVSRLGNFGGISDPEATWHQRMDTRPTAAVIADGAVIVTMRGAVEARDLDTGDVLWTREADWAAVAGDNQNMVAIVGRRGVGLEAVDPASGAAKWKDGSAIGAWTYRDTVLTLSCGAAADCELAARTPADGNARWRTGLPGVGRVHAGANSELLGSRIVSDTYRDAVAAVPEPMPPLLGFPIDNRVQMVDTGAGRLVGLESPSSTSRIVALGGRVLTSTVVKRGDNCQYTLEARAAGTGGGIVWKKDGYDLGTVSGGGCEQRKDPSGSNGVIVATRDTDRRDVLVNVRDGRVIWAGTEGQKIEATDGRYGLVRTADGTRVVAIDLSNGGTAWQVETVAKSDVAITRWAALVSDLSTSRIRAYDPASGRLLVDVKTSGEVLGAGPTGLILGSGRTVGFVPYGTIFAP